MTTKKLKRIALFGIAIGIVGVVVFITLYTQSRTLLDRKLQRLIYPGSHEIEQHNKSQEMYFGRWRTSDPIDTVNKYYNKMGFKFDDISEEEDGSELGAVIKDAKGMWRSTALIDEQDGTIIELHIVNSNPNFWASIRYQLKIFWSKLLK